jgi:A/G-specific adenine glycosylase
VPCACPAPGEVALGMVAAVMPTEGPSMTHCPHLHEGPRRGLHGAKTLHAPQRGQVRSVQAGLLKWSHTNLRIYPWRLTRDPYRVLVAEKLLQQTAASEAVVTAYTKIMSAYPNAAALSRARRRDLIKILRPLGLLYRGEELRRLGLALCTQYGGEVPSGHLDLVSLPGVGEYIARAVRSFAFGFDCGLVDANIARILYRLLLLPGKRSPNPARSRTLLLLAEAFVPRGNGRQFNLGLIDLASAICTATKPKCEACPISSACGSAPARQDTSPRTQPREGQPT